MEQYFLFHCALNQSIKGNFRLIIFCSGTELHKLVLKKKLRDFFSQNYPPNEIWIMGGKYIKNELIDLMRDNSDIFDVIRSFESTPQNTKVILFDSSGNLSDSNGENIEGAIQNYIFHQGIIKIFKDRGGMINSPSSSYHYIFPSGKHSSKFIRAGNVLITGSEIFFIAVSLLKYLKEHYTQIYCDTSSINSVAFALVELKKRFFNDLKFPSIVSFGSYEKFEKFDFSNSNNSLIIISASTSGNIIRRLQEHHTNLSLDNIIVLFYLSDDKEFSARVICDLSYSTSNPDGYSTEDLFPNELKCKLCEAGSYRVKISGDVFLLEKPQIKKILLKTKDAPEKLSQFMHQFYCRNGRSLIKCFFGEEPSRLFENYLDSSVIEDYIQSFDFERGDLYKKFREKYERILNQHVPTNLRYVIYLPDKSSKLMAERIKLFTGNSDLMLIRSTELLSESYPIKSDETGTVLIVSSCLVTGSNLLYVNKFLRRHQKLAKTFIIAIGRTLNSSKLDFIVKNITQGDLGSTQMKFIEKIHCSDLFEDTNETSDLSWNKEIALLRELKDIVDQDARFSNCMSYISDRLKVLSQATSTRIRGLVDNVFLTNPISRQKMEIAKNFAFFDFDDYHGNATQSDIYFTISCILNNLRCSEDKDRKIIQEEYQRTLLDPENFTRFDDGIIQSALLRTAKHEELNYTLEYESSNRIKEIISKMIDGHEDKYDGESLIEFLFAICIRKLRLLDNHTKDIISKIARDVKNDILRLFAYFIQQNILKQTEDNF